MSVGPGLPSSIDGPPPIERPYTLLTAADAPSSGVRIIPDQDGGLDRWGGGAQTWPYPVDKASVFDACAPASEFQQKPEGTRPTVEGWAAFTVVLPITCGMFGLGDEMVFQSRAALALAAVESAAVELELLAGALMTSNPFLADGTGTFPGPGATNDDPTSIENGVALLEEEIARSHRGGVLHMSPEVAFSLSSGLRGSISAEGGVVRTVNGTLVIPGAGYAGGSGPINKLAATGNEEWIYASGAVDIRRSAVLVVPDNLSEALDRSTNEVTFRVERDYLVTWDNTIHAAVKVDRCKATC